MKTGRPRLPVFPRFVAKYKINSMTGCWEWLASKDKDGYGKFVWYDCNGDKRERAHRFAYEYFVGPIPHDLCIDHLCKNTKCVNPLHLEAVTIGENVRRGDLVKTHCINGHLLIKSDSGKNKRQCPICRREADNTRYANMTDEERKIYLEKCRQRMAQRRALLRIHKLTKGDHQ